MNEKICRVCERSLKLSEFHKDKAAVDGYRNTCKICKAKYDKEFQSIHRDRYLKQRKTYRQKHIEIERAKGRKWSRQNYRDNKVKVLDSMKEYYRKNKDHKSSYNKEYRSTHLQECRERDREYYRNNKHIRIAGNARRRVAVLQAIPSWANLEKIKDIYKQREELTKQTGIVYHVDHIIPLRGRNVCGLHVENNLRVIPGSDNLSKHCKLIDE